MSKILEMLQGLASDAVKNSQEDDSLGIDKAPYANQILDYAAANNGPVVIPAKLPEALPQAQDLPYLNSAKENPASGLNPEMVDKFGLTDKDVYQGNQALKTAQVLDGVRNKRNMEREQVGNLNPETETLFQTITKKAGEYFGNEENMLNMALAFNTLRFEPDQQLAAGIQGRLKTIEERKTNKQQAGMIYNQLMEMGEKDAAAMVQANPESAKEILKQVAQKKFAKGASPTISGLQTDPITGQQYVVRTNPTTGKSERIDIEGALGMTPEQKAGLENQQQEYQFGIEQAQRKSEDIFDSIKSVDSQINNLNTMKAALDNGADSGIIQNYLPAFNVATANLRGAANSLGIDIINSATFGALSATELELALKTPIDMSLDPIPLRNQVMAKLAAQKKLREELRKDALMLARGGVTFNEYVQNKLKTVTPMTNGNQSQKPGGEQSPISGATPQQAAEELRKLGIPEDTIMKAFEGK